MIAEKNRARLELVFDELDEVLAGWNVVGILENPVGAEPAAKRWQQGEDVPGAILAAMS